MTADCWTAEDWDGELEARRRSRTRSNVTHQHRCDHRECGGVFRCLSCRRLFGWCYGGGCGGECDDRCDGCANRLHCEVCDYEEDESDAA
jgi:hypothetical protein